MIDLYCLQNILFHFWPKVTHAAVARSLCDSWATCILVHVFSKDASFNPFRWNCLRHRTLKTNKNNRLKQFQYDYLYSGFCITAEYNVKSRICSLKNSAFWYIDRSKFGVKIVMSDFLVAEFCSKSARWSMRIKQ